MEESWQPSHNARVVSVALQGIQTVLKLHVVTDQSAPVGRVQLNPRHAVALIVNNDDTTVCTLYLI